MRGVVAVVVLEGTTDATQILNNYLLNLILHLQSLMLNKMQGKQVGFQNLPLSDE